MRKMKDLQYSAEVKEALDKHLPLVALESTVITHGLPMPKNLEVARALEDSVKSGGAVPATIAILNGEIHIGLEVEELDHLASSRTVAKVSRRDIAGTLLKKYDGGTTVSGTMTLAEMAGLKIFATGGIGGVHRGNWMDVSADLPTLGCLPLIVVCSGAKSILDLPATREYLETSGVPVLGYRVEEFPAFYSKESGLKVDYRVDTPGEIAEFAKLHWDLGLASAVLVTVPVPDEFAIPTDEMDQSINQALEDMEKKGISGAASTPFLLAKVSELTGERSLRSNVALLKNNARVAGEIAVDYYR
jgi:pseudouridine-5'-phosphate glycosidase